MISSFLTRANLVLLLTLLTAGWMDGQSSANPLASITVQAVPQPGNGPPWDRGTLALTVNGRTNNISYGRYSTPGSVASGLAATFSQDCASPVFAFANGSTVSFYARHGSSPALTFSQAVSYDTQDFSHGSFVLSLPQSQGGSQAPTQTQLSATNLSGSPGGPYRLTANVSPTNVTGTVLFFDGGSNFGTGQPNAPGSFSFTTGVLSVGSHTLSASYSGDGNYTASTSSPFSITVPYPHSPNARTVITGVVPPFAGPGASPIQVNGAGFGSNPGSLTLNGVPLSVLNWSDTAISFTVPAAATTGALLVSTSTTLSNAVPFIVTSAPAPCPTH